MIFIVTLDLQPMIIIRLVGSAVLRRYVHSSRDDDPQFWLEGAGNSNISYVYTNYQGSVIATTNAAGRNLQIYKCSSYGEPMDAIIINNTLRFKCLNADI